MNIEEYRDYCMSFPQTSEGFPFDEKTLVFKVAGKMFALADVEDFSSVNLKCDPEKAIQLREEFPEVMPGYHMSKKHWNTVEVNSGVDDDKIKEWIKDSYDLVVQSLTKKLRTELGL
ncbi:MAG: MmcQ/YjbR family DNA-binding protein [Flavobacteriales bacterium]|nr:MmcQ/YjbR family DNA-binding protein [Flavobacteriales bacterium]